MKVDTVIEHVIDWVVESLSSSTNPFFVVKDNKYQETNREVEITYDDGFEVHAVVRENGLDIEYVTIPEGHPYLKSTYTHSELAKRIFHDYF